MPLPSAKDQREVYADLAKFQHDPYRYVLWAFPWGVKGSELEHETGPRDWQKELLQSIGSRLKAGVGLSQVIQEAVASGHGIGKSTIVAWIVLWAMSTFEDTRGVVTASTSTQLETKTWPEVAKWHRMALNGWMFTVTVKAIYSVDPKHSRTWRIDAVPWSEENTEAFAGLHNLRKRILLLFDEGSAIADKIWEVSEGALTDANTEIIWAAFGNPTRNTGRFKECFGKFKHRWRTRHIDSRTVKGATNLDLAAAWVEDYGEDSDFVRVRVRGEFPKASSLQFIPEDWVERARKLEVAVSPTEPLILGVDVARFGDDQSVIFARRGRDCRTWNQSKGIPDSGPWCYRGLSTDQLSARVMEIADRLKADAIFVDGGGVGGGVVDRLRMLHRNPVDVQFGARADASSIDSTGAVGEKYANKRAEMWGAMRAALKAGVALPDDADLASELCAVEYSFNQRDEILLEAKASMRKRGMGSPDMADALALTYAYPITASLPIARLTASRHQVDYDPYET